MKPLIRYITLGALGTATWLAIDTTRLPAQDAPPPMAFNPEQMRQRMLERMREQFDVKDDAEWKLISERLTKVMDARRAAGGPGGGPGGFGFGPGGPGGPGGAAPQDGAQGSRNTGDQPRGGPGGPGGFGRPSSPELDALRQAIESKASAAELKTALAAYRAARQKKEADLEKAQDELRQVLSVRQEAVAVAFGLLK